MTLRTRLLSFAAAAALTASGAALLAGEGGVAADLEQYYPIRSALASDKTDGIAEHAAALAKSQDKAVAAAAQTLAKATEIDAVRKSFGDLSKALIAELEGATKAGQKLASPIYVYQCPMAKPYGKWIQESDDMGNPYYGSKMLKCGKLIGSAGGAKEGAKDAGEGHDHGDDCCGGKKKQAPN